MIGYCNPKREVRRFLVQEVDPVCFAIMTSSSVFQKSGSQAPAFLVVDFERHLKHYGRAQRQARYPDD